MILPIDRGDIPDEVLVFVECSGEIFTIGDIDNLVMRSAVQFAAMLSTGLRDLAGVEVFEGDVVLAAVDDPDGNLTEDRFFGEVIWEGAAFHIRQPHDRYAPMLTNRAIRSLKVVGNVWETPSLREGCAPP
jgi:hypothetical protein